MHGSVYIPLHRNGLNHIVGKARFGRVKEEFTVGNLDDFTATEMNIMWSLNIQEVDVASFSGVYIKPVNFSSDSICPYQTSW